MWVVGGWTSLGFAVIGVLLPLLPTVPFVLVAAYCFSRGSKKLHRWLLRRPHFGRTLRDWERDRVIGRRQKWIACLGALVFLAYTAWIMPVYTAVKWIMAALTLAVLSYVVSRPSQPPVAATGPKAAAGSDAGRAPGG